MWIFPFTLIVPNVILDITDYSNWLIKVVNIFLPLGLYMIAIGASKNVGRTLLYMFLLIFYAAFQIVLLYLYGESIIAIDMFINVVTTNVSEATELLGNLALAIITVVILYVPQIIWAILLIVRKEYVEAEQRYKCGKTGMVLASLGIICTIIAYAAVPRFDICRSVFPINVMYNTYKAVDRTIDTHHYYETSAQFEFDATTSRPQNLKEIYVLVIGETSRADNWQLAGYGRPTNPLLSVRDSVIFYPKALSQSNTTHKSVPLLLSGVGAENFADSIYTTKSLITAFNQVGYRTAFLSNQARNHSFIDFFAREAQVVDFLTDDGKHHYDKELLKPFVDFLETSPSNKIFVVLHTYGSHFNYNERYPADKSYFKPDRASAASAENRNQLLNAYDNTIRYTDEMIDSVISVVKSYDCPAAVLYLSDHGEDIFDDARNRFLHASPVPTYYQIHVPVMVWISKSLDGIYPSLYDAAYDHKNLNVASSRIVFDTMLDLAGIRTRKTDLSKSLVNRDYNEGRRIYLNDYNEAVPLRYSGLRNFDIEQINKKNISLD